MLSGLELFAKVRERGDAGKSEIVVVSEALLDANGLERGASAKLARAAHAARLERTPGDAFVIQLGRKQIRLVPVGASEDDEE
ncbi:MAG: hypothetical protein ACK55X_09135 [Synechococcaceae cyanobacterium]|jgi:hypothetical protein